MEIKDRIVVVTGAASGIGRALAQRFAKDGARRVICSDINAEGVKAVAAEVGGRAFVTDVSKEDDIRTMIETVEAEEGPIDLFCSNAASATAAARKSATSAGSESGTSTSWPTSGQPATSCR